jgi:hypothetical protein
MNSKIWIRKALSMCLVITVIASYSAAALANTGKIAGELLVSGKNLNGEAPTVQINGEAAKSGRSVFSSSTIVTPEDANAIINLGKIGKIELAPNTILALTFNEKGISGDLTQGRVTVLSASDVVNIKTLDGTVLKLNAGEVAAANGKARQDDDDDAKSGGAAWLPWALIVGGAVAGIVVAAVVADNETQLGGGTTVVSPSR